MALRNDMKHMGALSQRFKNLDRLLQNSPIRGGTTNGSRAGAMLLPSGPVALGAPGSTNTDIQKAAHQQCRARSCQHFQICHGLLLPAPLS